MERCDRCKEWRANPKRCPCELFQCQEDWSPQRSPWSKQPDPDNWTDVYALDAEEAAKQFAEESDRGGDYVIISSGSGRVWVRNATDTVTRWNIEAESVPEYRAYEATASAGSEA